MVKLSIGVIFLLSIVGDLTYGAIKSINQVNLELRRKKVEISGHQKNLDRLKKQILSLRNNVSGETNKFSKIISIKTNLKSEINSQKKELTLEKSNLEKEIGILRKIFAGLILTEDSEQEVDYRYLTLKSLKMKEGKLKDKKLNINSMIKNIQKLEKELEEYDFIEADLIGNIEKMHQQEKSLSLEAEKVGRQISDESKELSFLDKTKNELVAKRERERKRKRKIKLERERVKERERLYQLNKLKAAETKKVSDQQQTSNNGREFSGNNSTHKILSSFSLPLRAFDRIKKDKAGGISMYVSTGREIVAPKAGEVLYTGKLSTYGNVIVIKHEDDYQSVILGDIISNVSKKQVVRKDEVIGKIIENSGDEKKLYFELRNKNKKVSYKDVFKGISI